MTARQLADNIRDALGTQFALSAPCFEQLDELVAIAERAEQAEHDAKFDSEVADAFQFERDEAVKGAEQAEEALAEVKAGFNAYFDDGDLNALLRTESIINRAQERLR